MQFFINQNILDTTTQISKINTNIMGKKRSRSESASSSSSSSVDDEAREKQLNRDEVKNRKSQWEVANSDDDDSASSADNSSSSYSDSSSDNYKMKEKKSKKHKKKSKKHHKKEHKKDHKKERKKDKKHKSSKSKSKSKSKTPSSPPPIPDYSPVGNAFGSYGIVKESDFYKESVQRSFEAWLSQVKKFPVFTGPKWELMELFKEFAEGERAKRVRCDSMFVLIRVCWTVPK